MKKRVDAVYLHHMLDAAREIDSFLAGVSEALFYQNRMLQSAVAHQLQVIGEAARQVSREFQAEHPEVPWSDIIGTRHRIVHDYLNVDLAVVWSVTQEDLPALRGQLATILSSLESDPDAS
ncbi:MAG: DUF86 domain-containing protein [Anaerolineae bacterium]|nr:DUF86 domain-containing protein [Anaerolineae bacterium]